MSLSRAELRQLKAAAQHLEPVVFVGKQGLSAAVVRSVDDALAARGLIKVRFVAGKAQRHEWAQELAQRTGSHLVTVVGHVAVLYRAQATTRDGPSDR
ncbi:MAG: YhbY family RNA-binding protein [Verrucomicrobiae bacterium]|nr:YhbY family RNA-binding protein [Verrucomicrobiae bacterium]MDW8343327.1 YhbY family RNA-binding protein [Verrucomicrobiae bacterium]